MRRVQWLEELALTGNCEGRFALVGELIPDYRRADRMNDSVKPL